MDPAKESGIIMNKSKHCLSALLLATSLSFSCATVFGQSENPAWIDELTLQLLLEHECELAEYEILHEGKLGGQNSYTARAACKDGRRFDASRIGDEDDFNIRLCEVVSC